MMFDGAIAATAAEATASAEHPTTDPAKTQTADDSTQPASDAATPPAASSDQRQEIVFVDGKLQDYQQLVSEIKPGTEVVVLDGSRGGLQQIAEYLNGRSGIDAIHLLSHGEAGVFRAGSDWIDANALAAQSATLARIGAALSENGDILLYGCMTGEGAAGAALVNELARLTQADVAASSDNTGALALGGDWILETRSGSIDSIALAPTAFSGLLAAPTSLNFDSVNLDADGDGDPTRSLGGSPWVFDGWTVTLHNSAGAIVTVDTQDYLYVTNNTGDNVLVDGDGDKALTVHGFYGIAASARFTATSGEEFWLQSFVIENISMSTGIRVEGYREGDLVASHNFTLNNGSGVYSTSTITLDHLGDQDWQNIDQFRIVQQNGSPGLWFVIDDIVVASKVLPNTPPTATNLTQSKTVTEGGGAVALDDIVVSDPDTGDNITATLTLSSPAAGSLSTGTFGSATSTYNPGTGVWNVSGSRTDVNAALAAVALTPSADNEQNFTISTRIHDAANSGPADGSITVSVTAVNDAPTVANPIPNQAASEDAAFSLVVPSNTFSDADGDSLTYTAQLAGGGALPTWLSFDPSTGTFSGTPTNGDVGTLSIDVIASDGNGGSVTDTFNIVVANTNDAPTVANPIPNQNVSEDTAFSFQFAGNTFADVDVGATLTYSAQLAGGGTLPAWLSFDSVTRTFSGTPTNGDVGTLSIDVIASDGNGGSVTDTFDIVVGAVNDAPVISAPTSITVTEDVPGGISGISFSDVDAGANSVTATFSVPSGTLAATTSLGVTVTGSGTGLLTLSGSIANINAFIAASGVSFTTASNATANVALTVTIDDGGNTGTGGALTDSQTVTLVVSAVNDAPVNSVPAAQSVYQDANLVFNSGNGNLISISDVDAGGGTLRVTLTASNGLITLSGTTGLSFLVGSGSGDGTMTFEGTATAINNALNGLTFSPAAGYNGAASLQITTNDLDGGAQSDSDTLNITVNSLNPRITDVSSSTANGTYKVGDTITITTTFDQAVTVDTTGGSPTLLLETGLTDRIATYVSGSGSNTLTFSYTVQAGDLSSDLDYQSTAALALDGATIRNVTSNDAVLTLPAMATAGSLGANKAIVIDGVAATVSSVAVPANGTYVAGQNLDFTVNLSESVTVDTSGGTPRIAITLNTGGTVYASYVFGSGTGALVFRLTVASGQLDSNGISIGSSIEANGGTLRDAAGNNSVTTLNSVGSTSGVLVDAVAPQVSAISLDDASPTSASSVSFTLTFSEGVSGVDLGDLALNTSGSVSASLQSLEQIDAHTYRVTVGAISGVGSLGLSLNVANSTIVDSAGNALTGTFSGQTYSIVETAVTPSPAPVPAPAPAAPVGDPEFLSSMGATPALPPAFAPPAALEMPGGLPASPLLPPPLFEVRTVGGDLPPLGTIFLGNSSSPPSFIAQVFGSSDTGLGGDGQGFLGFGDSGIFGSSTFATIFGRDVPGVSEMNVFSGSQWKQSDLNQGLRGVFGVPTFGQQLHELHEGEQRQLRELALALGQLEGTPTQA